MLAITADGLAVRAKIWSVYAPAIQAAIGARLSRDEAVSLARSVGKITDVD